MNPPPPPPHGEVPKSSGLPPGKYDIFIIPPHSSGSGFLYLPSLQPNINSFAAGFASALIIVAIGSMLAPAFQVWWYSVKGSGGMGMMLIVLAVGVGAWALGRTQTDAGPAPGASAGGAGGGGSGVPPPGSTHSNTQSNGYSSGPAPGQHGPAPGQGPPPGPGPTPNNGGGAAGGGGPKSSWQRPNPPPPGAGTYTAGGTANGAAAGASAGTAGGTPNSAKGAWERAREETKKKEEERKAREAEKRRKDELEKRIKEAREKEAREREAREREAREKETRERESREKETRERESREKESREKEAREREIRERVARERSAREALVREREKEAREREVREKAREMARETKGSSYAFSAVGEKTNPWPRGQPTPPAARSQGPSPTKKPPAPTAKTHKDEEAFSYRPYDTPPKKPTRVKSPSSSYSESSYAASQSTARTTPPPSHRGRYSTKDPDKIVLKAVYSFNNDFIKTPSSQLVSGVGSVTDGLILRITTEGLFIDDDVRGVPQREWDVKAWTMKLVEVWCPSFCQGPAGPSASARVAFNSAKHNPVRRLWGMDKEKAATSEETDALLVEMLQSCRDTCRSSSRSAASASSAASSFDDRSSVASDSAYGSSVGSPSPRNHRTNRSQTGDLKSAGLHVLRASIRDQNGKKYLFVIADEESWKIAIGLQRLRKGSQVRALGVSGMSANDARGTLENLGWA